MAQKRYEHGGTDYRLDFDPEEKTEYFSSNSGNQRKSARYGTSKVMRRVEGRKRVIEDDDASSKIYAVRRTLACADARFAAGIIKQATMDFDPQLIENISPSGGATLMTANHARSIFRRIYLPGSSHNRAIAEFNGVVEEASTKINDRNPIVNAKLGEIGIFGPDNARGGSRAPNIVYWSLSDEATETLQQDHRLLVRALRRHKDFPTRRVEYTPHLSIVTVDSHETALALRAHLQERIAGLPEVFEREITLGRAGLKASSAT